MSDPLDRVLKRTLAQAEDGKPGLLFTSEDSSTGLGGWGDSSGSLKKKPGKALLWEMELPGQPAECGLQPRRRQCVVARHQQTDLNARAPYRRLGSPEDSRGMLSY